MELYNLKARPEIDQDKKLNNRYLYFQNLILELHKREIPEDIIMEINKHIEVTNAFDSSHKDFKKQIHSAQYGIIKLLEAKLKIVPKNLYRGRWMAIGMSVFGVPMGVAFGVSMGNMAFLGIGIPIGMVIGMAIGANMDNKAFEEGRQLDIELNY